MTTETKPNVIEYRRKRTIPNPKLMIGWCILREEKIDARTEGGILVPSGGESAMETLPIEMQAPIMRYTVVSVAPQYPVNATTLAETPFGPGDVVALVPTSKALRERRLAIAIPDGCIAAWIADVAAWQPREVGEPFHKKPEPKS